MSISPVSTALDQSILPSASSADLIVVPVTPAEYEQTWHLNADEWKGPLTLPQYFERERRLLNRELTKDNAITAWILTSTKLPPNSDGIRPILASCETLLKTAYVVRDGNVESVRAHGICSVYTRSEYRGKGYAGRMMVEVGKQLETYQQLNGDKGSFSVLFSDIGQTFYSRYGWKAFASSHIDLAPLNDDGYEHAKKHFPAVQDITREALDQLPTISYLEETLRVVSKRHPKIPCVAIRPDTQHFDWHHAREEIQTQLLHLPFPHIKGSIHKATGIALVWCRVFASNPREWSLHVLHVAIPPALRESSTDEARDALSALLLRAQHEASTWKMAAGVQVWDPSELVVAAAQSLRTAEEGKVEVVRREKDHICSLRWNDTRDDDEVTGKVIWVNAEKYTWC